MLGFSPLGQRPLGGQVVTIYTVTGEVGSFVIDGQAALLKKTWPGLIAGATDVTLSGSSVTLNRGYLSQEDAGSFSLSGNAVSFERTFNLKASSGAVALTGVSAGKIKGYAVRALAGSYAVAGKAAVLRDARLTQAGFGSFALDGTDTAGIKGFHMASERDEFNLVGFSTSETHLFKIRVEAGTFAISEPGGHGTNLSRRRPHVVARSYGGPLRVKLP